MIHPAMKSFLLIIAMAFSALLSAAGQTARLTLIPPLSVTASVPVEIRAGIVPEEAGEYDITVSIDTEDDDGFLCSQKARLSEGEAYCLEHSLSVAGMAGKHRIIMSVNTPDGKVLRRTEEITVLESGRRSPGTIGGAWMGLYHWSETEGKMWNDDIRKLTARQWRMLVRDMHSLGMDIIVIQEVFRNQMYVGRHDVTTATYEGRAFYPSEIYPGRMPVRTEDPLEAIFSEADRLGMKVFPGIGLFAWFDFSEESLAWHKLVAGEIWERYGHHESFYGFYVSEESVGSLDNCEPDILARALRKKQITGFFKEFDEFCESLAPGLPVMLATNSMGILQGADTYPALLEHLDILCPFGFARMPEGDLTGKQAADTLQSMCDKAGAHLWFDLEAFLFRPDMSLYPRDIEGIMEDLMLLDNFEKILCYQYPGVFNNPRRTFIVGERKTRTLFRQYEKFLKDRMMDGGKSELTAN